MKIWLLFKKINFLTENTIFDMLIKSEPMIEI